VLNSLDLTRAKFVTDRFWRNAVIHNGVLDQDVNFISKPFTIEQLASKARAVLDGANS
jgi:hypothetical protein